MQIAGAFVSYCKKSMKFPHLRGNAPKMAKSRKNVFNQIVSVCLAYVANEKWLNTNRNEWHYECPPFGVKLVYLARFQRIYIYIYIEWLQNEYRANEELHLWCIHFPFSIQLLSIRLAFGSNRSWNAGRSLVNHTTQECKPLLWWM